ncbi:MAG TPA: hypothetical protein VHY31_06860 [Streptosporangiaceae bacterium]|nr:hypothetical protein [Streptosporangiaceae bacterium]
MTDRPLPGDGSLPSAENPAARGPGQGAARLPEGATRQAPRFTADIMLIGTGWHQPEQPQDPPPPSASPDALAGVNGPHGPRGLAGASESARAELEAAFGAGFSYRADRDRAHRDRDRRDSGGPGGGHGGGQGGGFAAGGVLAQMLPGAELGCHLAAARRAGFGRLSDYELCGVIAAYDRQASADTAGKLAAVAEFDARRAGPGGRPGEHAGDEIAALLTLTGRSASDLTGLARDLARLPQTQALLASGIISPERAELIAAHLAVLPGDDAAAVETKIAPRAGDMTTGRLARALAHAVKAHDPHAAKRRRERAQKDARVEVWAEPSGTAALAGRDLPPAGVIEATKSLDADARWLKAHGVEGSFDQLRAKAFEALLSHNPLTSLIPAGDDPAGPSHPGTPAASPAHDSPAPAEPGPGPGQTGPRLGGTVHLTMPATTWLGLSDNPGDIPGTGPTDADTCRDLAETLAANPATRWCITLTDPHGRAVAHGCAHAGPGPPGPGHRTWLATVTTTPIAAATCDHRHQSAGYQPSPTLRHLVKTRSPRCGYPGCRRPAWRCDDDHTIPHHKGGRTCECNLHPLCRHHHQTKQAPGWHLTQPQPGVLVWTTPSGRTYTTTAEPYPT